MASLRHKIIAGYSVAAALVAALALFSFAELHVIEKRVGDGERIAEFVNAALEIRRFEKNYFLYHQQNDLSETRAWVERARGLLREQPALFDVIAGPGHAARIMDDLARYDALLTGRDETTADATLAQGVRLAGKRIATAAEAMAGAERRALQAMLDRHRRLMIGSVVFVALAMAVLGALLVRRVGRPLREMEASMAAVAAGRLHQLEIRNEDHEIASLTDAFNRMLRELELRQGQLVRAEKLAALGTLLSGVAHEINNPLSNISTSCEILAEEIGAGTAADGQDFQRELIAQIDTETWRARRIVRSLLDYARDREFKREHVPLAPLVEDTLRLMRGRIGTEVEIHLDIVPGLAVPGDRQRLQQVLLNLVGNALGAMGTADETKAPAAPRASTGTAGLRLAARRTTDPPPATALVFGQCPGDVVEIIVGDDGHGIAPDILPRIFDPFFTTRDVGHGLGLGLFIVFEIIEEHDGCIAVESTPGVGSTFRLRLPASIPEKTE